ncbi:TPA: hypothetical protein NER77_004504 [Pseudomonas aeruginosa]|nr:hypothetical protein [Pseudomonas aeruginosa]HCE0991912.1 hypothetical protein [Pseudomonas aeruginosa]HCE3944577.1 hypothetical protein [Pseudomonas aeruginosa]
MRERPILFSGPMVRAIIEGRKKVTRRVVKPQPDFLGSMTDPNTPFKTLGAGLHGQIVCPYGQPGDRLWVRETFAVYGDEKMAAIHYRADRPHHVGQKGMGYKPSIHMPRWASRILLEITAVRVERLQDISQEQAMAEGVLSCESALDPDGNGYSPYELFSALWVSINGHDSWHANPWVWVVEFKRVEVGND